ncbi:hypothetical protein JHK82_019817 [Glycine max]|nr:hypothetical protein JHK85_020266 [Glycine max]KAG5038995.1 hypothetical protein JHK86_019835 [Glycine max]KAG5144122.1 hypothetical protein JHK82_019817 [Glycine max]
MLLLGIRCWVLVSSIAVVVLIIIGGCAEGSRPHRILVDTDVDTDDFFALLYLLKFNASQFQLEGISISANAWTSAGHAVNHIYDLLYMMGRDDVAVGVGGEGGILQNGTILPNVGGYLPIVEQGMTTVGGCRYRGAIPVGLGGRLDIDANYGIRKAFLPQCGDRGNMFTDYNTNPYAEFNIFGDPFAAYQSYFMWDSFTAGVAVSIMSKPNNHKGENEFAEMEYMNITVITSNKPYGVSDGSNPFFDGRRVPKFNLEKGGVHSGHVQQGLRDPLCFVNNGKGKCQDGYTAEVSGPDSVRVLVATKAKPNKDVGSSLDREYFISFLNVLKHPQNAGRFNFITQFPYYKEVTYKPDFQNKTLGKPVVFDMDMSAGDFLALFYLLKVPVQVIDLKALIVSPTGWTNSATIDVIYDLLHMMGRDDIPVGLGDVFAMNQSDPIFPPVGECKYVKAIPHGSGGLLDSDTLYGLARDLPRSPRRYTAENSEVWGAPRDTDHPELRQPLAMEVWDSVLQRTKPRSKITVLTNGPLTNLAKVVSVKNISSRIQEVYVVGGHLSSNVNDKGNIFSVPSNQYAEFNMFLDPLAAKTVFESEVNITLIPLNTQRQVSSFSTIIGELRRTPRTPEAVFSERLLSRLYRLKQTHNRYQHMDTFLGEIVGAAVLTDSNSGLNPNFEVKAVNVLADGNESSDGKIVVDEKGGKLVRILSSVDAKVYYSLYANKLGDEDQSAKIGSFEKQRRKWNHPHSKK